MARGVGVRLNVRESVKYGVYRTPGLRRLMAPGYDYKVNPGQLAAMIGFIDATRASDAAVLEIGVAQGHTSVFLLEHLRTTNDPRRLHLFDTFSGFTPESISVEQNQRGHDNHAYDEFRYGSRAIFEENLRHRGYEAFETHAGDAAAFDWDSFGPVGAVLLDIDLYQPTKRILDAIHPHLVAGGGIVLDDCLPDTQWDGSLQAYEEFIDSHGLPFERVGEKGAIVRASSM